MAHLGFLTKSFPARCVTKVDQSLQIGLESLSIALYHIAQLVSHRTDRSSGMSADLLREHTGIHDSQSLDAVNLAFGINDTSGGIRAHTSSANGVVESESRLDHEALQLIVGDLVNIG